MDHVAPTPDHSELAQFLFRLGQALLASGEQTAKVELLLRRTATANGYRGSRVIAFPTAIFISLFDGTEERVTLAEGPTQALRLDQIADVYSLADTAQNGKIEPKAGLERLNGILRQPARFGLAGAVLGHAVLTVGLSIVLMPTLKNIIIGAILGTIVGVLKAFNRNRPVMAVPLPVLAALLVSTLVFSAMAYQLPVDPLYNLVPPLISFLPGAMLTLAMVELAYGDMVSGSSRLVTGFVQLLLLAFGLAAGALLVGYRPEDLVEASDRMPVPVWTSWLGVIVFGIGVYFHFSAPRRSFGWMMLVLLVTFAAQQAASAMFRYTQAGGFFGMLVATPLVYLIQLRFRGPPAMVTFLPSFWLLVPGALGLLSVKHMFSDRVEGLDGIMTAVTALASIALGSLMGASFYKWMTESFGWWELQIGRVGRYFRNKK